MVTGDYRRDPSSGQCSARTWWVMEETIFVVAGGKQAFIDLANAWHERCMADPIVSHAFSHGFNPEHTERLAAYWAEALGGPCDFSNLSGNESTVVRTHSGHGP